MATSKAKATWEGGLKGGKGSMKPGSMDQPFPFSFGTRFEGDPGTNPEELVGAAHSGCFSMAFSKMAEDAGHPPKSVATTADVHLEKKDDGFAITRIKLTMTADIPGMDKDQFDKLANQAKEGCPVSKALQAVDIPLDATLK